MQLIETMEQRLPEVGRIRCGGERGTGFGGRGKSLDNFRITVKYEERSIIDDIAALYGIQKNGEAGEVIPWFPNGRKPGDDDQHPPFWQTYLTIPKLPIAIPPISSTLNTSYEKWAGGYCVRRCNGVKATWYEQEPITDKSKRDKSGKPIKEYRKIAGDCQCDADDPHPDPNVVCQPVARLNILIVGLPVAGVFRLESHSKNFIKEAPAMVALAETVFAHTGRPVRADLYIVSRQSRSLMGGERNFKVPVVRIYEALTLAVLNAPPAQEQLGPGKPYLQLVGPAQTDEDGKMPLDDIPEGFDPDVSEGEFREPDFSDSAPDFRDVPAWETWVLSKTFGELRSLPMDPDAPSAVGFVARKLKELGVVGQGAIQVALGLDPVTAEIDHLVSGEVIDYIRSEQNQKSEVAGQPAEPGVQQETML